MLGLWPSGKEQCPHPLRGYKLAYPMISADGKSVGFTGVSLGRSQIYGVSAEAVCAQAVSHRCPSTWCDCGFYCFHEIDDARAMAGDPEYQQSVLLAVDASGRYLRYEKGLRYAHQVVRVVRVGRCGCGRPADAFADTDTGGVGWRRLVPMCSSCPRSRPAFSLESFAEYTGRVTVRLDEQVAAFAGRAAQPAEEPPASGDDRTSVPVLSAEVALLQARLDDLQSQLQRLQGHD